MNLITKTDAALVSLGQEIANEIDRRSRAATEGHDGRAIIKGNELAKRALIVAAAGKHSILFVGPAQTGKTMLRAAALELGLANTFEAWPCACGNHGLLFSDCVCTKKRISNWRAKFPKTDINVETMRVTAAEQFTRATTLTQMRKQIGEISHFESLKLDESSESLLKATTTELGLDPVDIQRIKSVARTIANLDKEARIKVSHLCEAINYRCFGY